MRLQVYTSFMPILPNPFRGLPRALGGAPCWLLGLALLSLVLSCKAPDASDGPADAAVGSTGTGPEIPSGPCYPAGDYRCNPDRPNELEVCDPLNVNGWTFVDACETPDLCDTNAGRCLTCPASQLRCDGFELEACNADGSAWELLRTCENEQYCDRAGGQCAHCLPGMGYCGGEDQSTLFLCNASRTAFDPTQCDRPGDCNTTAMTCRPCFPGEYQCNKAELQQCNEASEWVPVETCTTEALCKQTQDALQADPTRAPTCQPPACTAGERKCSEDDARQLLACPPSQDAWTLVDVCATAELCELGLDTGMCSAAVCSPGSPRCEGLALQVCNAEGTGYETLRTCAAANECNVLRMDCIACTPGEEQCNGALRQSCNEQREWVVEETCASERLCETTVTDPPTTRCWPSACPVSTHQCSGAELEICNADKTGWTTLESCETEALCNAADARCDQPGCPGAGEVRCLGNVLQQCPDTLRDWEALIECEAGTACDPVGMGCMDRCPDQPYRCNGILPEHCVETEEGVSWEAAGAPCATAGLCTANAEGASCSAPVCGGTLPDFRCNGQVIEACNSQRTGWIAATTCAEGTLCDVGPNGDGPHQCDVCVANTYRCSNAQLMRCEANGQSEATQENCRDAAHCVADGTADGSYCLRCDEGETQCNGTNLDTCDETRRGWIEAEECDEDYGCHDLPGAADYCNACEEPGELRCQDNNTSLAQCDDEQREFGDAMTCQFGCQDDGTDDFCRDCAPNSAECHPMEDTERRVCDSTGRWGEYAECMNGSDCFNSGTADYCGSCTPGAYTCTSATQRQVCGMDGKPGAISTCPMNTPVCLASTGQCVQCDPAAPAQCTGAAGSADRRTCSPAGAWQTSNCSGNTSVCLGGACVACQPGTEQCTGTTAGGRRVCSAQGAWENRACTTMGLTTCWEGDCVACNPMTDAPRCTNMNSGREVCTAGTWTAANCTGGDVCVSGVCQDCNPATQPAECIANEAPSGRRVCTSGSWVDADCTAPTPVCGGAGTCTCEDDAYRCSSGMRQRCDDGAWISDACPMGMHCTGMGECAQCVDDDDCSADFPSCNDGTCECEVGEERCTAGGQHEVCTGTSWMPTPCTGTTPVCEMSTGTCVCMNGATRCQAGVRQTCSDGVYSNDPGNPACTACTTNAQCSGNAPICNGTYCVACSGNNCASGSVCAASGACVECTTSNTSLCTEEEPACSASNTCVECTATDDGACGGATPVCGSANECVECTASDAGACTGATPVCDDMTNTCVACSLDEECGALLCAPTGACVECLLDEDCAMGETCTDNACL